VELENVKSNRVTLMLTANVKEKDSIAINC